MLLCRSRHVDRSAAVHVESQVAIAFAAIHIGVSRRQDDPIGASALDQSRYLLLIPDVAIRGSESGDLVILPLAHQRFAQQAGGAEDSDSHAVSSRFR